MALVASRHLRPKPADEPLEFIATQLQPASASAVGNARRVEAKDRKRAHPVTVRLGVSEDIHELLIDDEPGVGREEEVLKPEADVTREPGPPSLVREEANLPSSHDSTRL